MSYTTENLLVEYQRTDIEDAPWQAWTFLGSEKSAGNWESCLPGEYVNRKGENLRLRFRLVKRTAVITDEVLGESLPEPHEGWREEPGVPRFGADENDMDWEDG
jgi:hypothetical protein